MVYPDCNETKFVISWLNCIFLEMAKPYDLWADTFINKFQQQFLFHWLEIIGISHYYLSIQSSDPIKVITKCPTSNQKLVYILCLFYQPINKWDFEKVRSHYSSKIKIWKMKYSYCTSTDFIRQTVIKSKSCFISLKKN